MLAGILVVVYLRSTAWTQRRFALLQLAALCAAASYLFASIEKSLASTTARPLRSPQVQAAEKIRLQMSPPRRGAAWLPLQR